jgi:hypothetical protein
MDLFCGGIGVVHGVTGVAETEGDFVRGRPGSVP